MHSFFTPQENISAEKIEILRQETIHHLKDVLWLKAGEEVMIFDEMGNVYRAEIESLTNKAIKLKVKEKLPPNTADKIHLTIACAIPKKSKFDDIVDKLTQLGVSRIIPLITERVIIKLDSNKEILRKARWEKIAIVASEQSKRNTIPLIDPPVDIKEIIDKSSNFNLKLIPTLEGKRKSLREIFNQSLPIPLPLPLNILVLIGPEGDFTGGEIKLALNSGFIPVSLGKEILRVETAAVAVASFIKFYEERA